MNPGLLSPIGPIRSFDALPRQQFGVGEMDRDANASGLVIDAERGYILTVDHTLRGSPTAVVEFADGHAIRATRIRRDPAVDLAVLIVNPQGLKLSKAAWGDPAALQPSDWVLSSRATFRQIPVDFGWRF